MVRGGNRPGSGRPKGSGKFGEPTQAIRIPMSRIEEVLQFVESGSFRFPFYECSVAAGFPSPADDVMENELDLNELLVTHPAATFFVRASGVSMIKAGIHDNDILVVDRSIEPTDGKIVIAAVNGELTVKRLKRVGKRIQLMAENDAYKPIDITESTELHIWGVVTNVIHRL